MQFPNPLPSSPRVALVAPASPFAQPHLLDQSVQALEAMGFSCEIFPSAMQKGGYLAGDDALRAKDLNEAFSGDGIDAVFCIRGGYGSMRLLPLLDYDLIRSRPKPLVGLSDITALELALLQKCALSSLHAPMPFRYHETPKGALDRLHGLLFGDGSACYSAEDGLFALQKGSVSAPMVGGNLSLVAALVSTEYFPNLNGKILFLEEVGECAYRLDRLLTTLSLHGVFERISGLVLGAFTDCTHEDELERILRSVLKKEIPCLGGFSAGHLLNNHGFLQGQTVTLNADESTLTFHAVRGAL